MRSLGDTQAFADRAVTFLRSVEWASDRAVVVGLSGNLGAGKTAFVQCVAKSLGITDAVTSPTFVLRVDYATTDIVFKKLIHIDAYRIERVDELTTIGWDDILAEPNTLVVVEWADAVSDRMPADACSVSVTVRGDERIFTTSMFAD